MKMPKQRNLSNVQGSTDSNDAPPAWGRLSVEERNALVLSHLECINSVIRRNYILIQAAHLDKDDVYQDLAIRLIRAVEQYKPSALSLKSYIFRQLQYEVLNCKSAKVVYGFHSAPYDLRNASISLEALDEFDPYWESKYDFVA